MTLQNCKKLLEHYESIVDGRISAPVGHKNWDLVLRNAKDNADSLRARIETKLKLPKYSTEVKTDGKKSKG